VKAAKAAKAAAKAAAAAEAAKAQSAANKDGSSKRDKAKAEAEAKKASTAKLLLTPVVCTSCNRSSLASVGQYQCTMVVVRARLGATFRLADGSAELPHWLSMGKFWRVMLSVTDVRSHPQIWISFGPACFSTRSLSNSVGCAGRGSRGDGVCHLGGASHAEGREKGHLGGHAPRVQPAGRGGRMVHYVDCLNDNKTLHSSGCCSKKLRKVQQILVQSVQQVYGSQVRMVGGPRVLQAAGRRRGGPALRHRHPAAQRDGVAPYRPCANDGHPGVPRRHVPRVLRSRMKARLGTATTPWTHRAACQSL